MNDTNTHIEELKKRILAFAQERDWEQFHSPKNLSMAISAEAAELMEHFLWQNAESSRKEVFEEPFREKITEELADIAEIDLTSSITEKMKKNALKYPVEKARGKCAKYTEL